MRVLAGARTRSLIWPPSMIGKKSRPTNMNSVMPRPSTAAAPTGTIARRVSKVCSISVYPLRRVSKPRSNFANCRANQPRDAAFASRRSLLSSRPMVIGVSVREKP